MNLKIIFTCHLSYVCPTCVFDGDKRMRECTDSSSIGFKTAWLKEFDTFQIAGISVNFSFFCCCMKMESQTIKIDSSKSKLPLEWTCVTRKRDKQGSISSGNSASVSTIDRNTIESSKDSVSLDEGEKSCTCCPPTAVDEGDDTTTDMMWKGEDVKNEEAASCRLEVMNHRGIGIFCLHDTDTSWFQGYFIPKSSVNPKPIGILAVQRDIDECIQCAFGGYRELDLTLYNFLKTEGGGNQENVSHCSSSITVPVVCTGGDMLRMRAMTRGETQDTDGSVVNIRFDATAIYTGLKAIPYLKTYFASLVKKQRELLMVQATADDDSEQDVTKMSELDLLPDCAIVCGSMIIRTTKLNPSMLSSAR